MLSASPSRKITRRLPTVLRVRWLFVLLLLVLLQGGTVDAADTLVGSKGRFKFWNHVEAISWPQARDACEADGGWLAVDLSEETHSSLAGVPGGGPYAWLGGTDIAQEGIWRWATGPAGREDNGRGRVFYMAKSVSGTNVAVCFFQDCFWEREPKLLSNQDYLATHRNIEWNDYGINGMSYSQVTHYYCEYPVPPEPPAAEAKNYQLFLRPNGITWYEARQTCTMFGGILASELDYKSKSYITDMGMALSLNNATAFLGGTDYTVRGQWRWVTGAAQEDDNNRGRLFYTQPSSGAGVCSPPPAGQEYIGCRWAASNPTLETAVSFNAIKRTGTSTVEWVSLTHPTKASGFVCEFPITATPTESKSFSAPKSATNSLGTSTSSNTRSTSLPITPSTSIPLTPSPSRTLSPPSRTAPPTPSRAATPSTSQSLSGSIPPTTSLSHTISPSHSVSGSASPTQSTTGTPSASAIPSGSLTSSLSLPPTGSMSSSPSHSITVTPPSKTAPQTPSRAATPSTSLSLSRSLPPTTSVSNTVSPSRSVSLGSTTPTFSTVGTPSTSESVSGSLTPSLSLPPTRSTSSSSSRSGTLSPPSKTAAMTPTREPTPTPSPTPSSSPPETPSRTDSPSASPTPTPPSRTAQSTPSDEGTPSFTSSPSLSPPTTSSASPTIHHSQITTPSHSQIATPSETIKQRPARTATPDATLQPESTKSLSSRRSATTSDTAYFYASASINVTEVQIDSLITPVAEEDNTTFAEGNEKVQLSTATIQIHLEGNDGFTPPFSATMDRSRACLPSSTIQMLTLTEEDTSHDKNEPLGRYFKSTLYITDDRAALLVVTPNSLSSCSPPLSSSGSSVCAAKSVPALNISASHNVTAAHANITIDRTCFESATNNVMTKLQFAPSTRTVSSHPLPPFVTDAPPDTTEEPQPTPEPKVVSKPFVEGSGDTATTVTVVSGMISSPSVASQGSRSLILLTLPECTPSVDRLPSVQSPTRFKLGDSKVSYYVGGTVMNHVVLISVGILQLIAAKIYQMRKKCTFDKAKQKMRFPSLLAFFAMFLLEPTSMCCWVTLTHAPDVGHRVIGGFSFALCLAVPAIAFVWILRDKAFKGKYHENWDEDPDNPDRGLESRNKAVFFFFGSSKWKDQPDNEGFCQKTRLFFCDYKGCRPITRSFLVVEMLIAILIGSLDGIKLGVGKCDGILICLLIIFTLYIIAIVVLRPYNAYFLMAFTLTMTSMQLLGAILLALGMFKGMEGASDAAEYTSIVCLYLVIGRVFFDLGPKLFRGYKGRKRAMDRKRGRAIPSKEEAGLLEDPLLQRGENDSVSDDVDVELERILVVEDVEDEPKNHGDPHEDTDSGDDGFRRGEFDINDADARFRKQLSDEEFQRLLAAAANSGQTVSAEDRDLLLARLEAMSERELLKTLVDRLQQLNGKGYRSALHTALESNGALGGGQLLSTLQHTRGLESIVLRQKILERERQAEEKEREKKNRANQQLFDILDGLEEIDEAEAAEAALATKARARTLSTAAATATASLASLSKPTNIRHNESPSESSDSSDYVTTSEDEDDDAALLDKAPSFRPSAPGEHSSNSVPHTRLNAADLEDILDEATHHGGHHQKKSGSTVNLDDELDDILGGGPEDDALMSCDTDSSYHSSSSSSSSSDGDDDSSSTCSDDSLMKALREGAI